MEKCIDENVKCLEFKVALDSLIFNYHNDEKLDTSRFSYEQLPDLLSLSNIFYFFSDNYSLCNRQENYFELEYERIPMAKKRLAKKYSQTISFDEEITPDEMVAVTIGKTPYLVLDSQRDSIVTGLFINVFSQVEYTLQQFYELMRIAYNLEDDYRTIRGGSTIEKIVKYLVRNIDIDKDFLNSREWALVRDLNLIRNRIVHYSSIIPNEKHYIDAISNLGLRTIKVKEERVVLEFSFLKIMILFLDHFLAALVPFEFLFSKDN